jgi:hypothetical protein
MLTQTLLLQLPLDYKYPHILKATTSENNAFIIDIGCKALAMSKDEAHKKDYEELFNSLKEQAKYEYEPKLESALKELATLQQFMKDEHQRYENAQKIASLAHETELQTLQQAVAYQTKQLREQIESLQLRMSETGSIVREEERKNREEILKEKDARILSLEQTIQQGLKSGFESIITAVKDTDRNILSVKDQVLKVSTNSNRKGKSSENSFAELLQKVFGATSMDEVFELQQVGSTESRSGDIKMLWREGKLMWEVKDYSKPIPKEEVQKFQRDMRSSPDTNLGIFVSLNTTILGKTKAGDIDLELLEDGRICIYLNEFNKQEDQFFYLQSLMPFLEYFMKYARTKAVEGDQELIKMQNTAKILLTLIQKHKKGLTEFKNFLQQTKKKFDTQWDELKVKLVELDMSTEYMLNTLLCSQCETESVESSPVDMDSEEETCFKAYTLETLTPNERKFLEVFRKEFQYTSDSSSKLSTTEIKKPLQEAGLSEETIKKCREKLILDTVWEKGKAVVNHIVKKRM